MRRSVKRAPKEVDRRLRLKTRGVSGALQNSGMPGHRSKGMGHPKGMSRPTGMARRGMSRPKGMARSMGMNGSKRFGRSMGMGGSKGLGRSMGMGRSKGLGRSMGMGGSMGAGHSMGIGRSKGLGRSMGMGRSKGLGRSMGMGRSKGLGRSMGMGGSMGTKGRGAMAGKLAGSQLKSRARTGMSRARTGASRVQTGMHRSQTGMHQAHTGATKAIAWMIPASIAARRVASHRMTAARGWTAPRIERAAVYFNGSMAPKIGSALSDTAAWIEPDKHRHRTRNTLLGGLAVCLAGAAVAVVVTRRRHQMEHLLEPEESLEAERYRQEQTLSGSYRPGSGQSPSSYGGGSVSGYGSGSVSGTRGVGGITPE